MDAAPPSSPLSASTLINGVVAPTDARSWAAQHTNATIATHRAQVRFVMACMKFALVT
jgi:hypothetical protein